MIRHNGSIHPINPAIHAFIVLQNKANSKGNVLQNDFSEKKESLCHQNGKLIDIHEKYLRKPIKKSCLNPN